ncbi:MAG: class I SAM-dependent methyltransferase, partial [Ottowia sp.]|nr:class I SAM-dependent methyltransferase [Ottowia sp.]
LPGVRLTAPRLRAYRIAQLVQSTHDVLDLGSNIGVISVEIARLARSIVGIEYSKSLNNVARKMALLYRKKNASFVDSTIEDFLHSNKTRYDLVLACAITQWIDLPLIEAFELIARSVKAGGHVLVESNNLDTYDKNFYTHCDEIAHALGWSIQFSDEGYDDLFYNRAVVVFKTR